MRHDWSTSETFEQRIRQTLQACFTVHTWSDQRRTDVLPREQDRVSGHVLVQILHFSTLQLFFTRC